MQMQDLLLELLISQPSMALILCLINRQTSSESLAAGSVSSGQQVIYEAICGKTGGFDAAALHMHHTVLLSSGRGKAMHLEHHC